MRESVPGEFGARPRTIPRHEKFESIRGEYLWLDTVKQNVGSAAGRV
jgi:hypothetical protein